MEEGDPDQPDSKPLFTIEKKLQSQQENQDGPKPFAAFEFSGDKPRSTDAHRGSPHHQMLGKDLWRLVPCMAVNEEEDTGRDG